MKVGVAGVINRVLEGIESGAEVDWVRLYGRLVGQSSFSCRGLVTFQPRLTGSIPFISQSTYCGQDKLQQRPPGSKSNTHQDQTNTSADCENDNNNNPH